MEPLVQELKVLTADTFAFFVKAQIFHWNVTGATFAQDHEFLGEVYSNVAESMDGIAERIRTLDAYAPATLERLTALGRSVSVTPDGVIPTRNQMFTILSSDNTNLLKQLKRTRDLADDNQENGIVNFLEDRIDYHKKLGWMLSSMIQR